MKTPLYEISIVFFVYICIFVVLKLSAWHRKVVKPLVLLCSGAQIIVNRRHKWELQQNMQREVLFRVPASLPCPFQGTPPPFPHPPFNVHGACSVLIGLFGDSRFPHHCFFLYRFSVHFCTVYTWGSPQSLLLPAFRLWLCHLRLGTEEKKMSFPLVGVWQMSDAPSAVQAEKCSLLYTRCH